MPHSHHSHSGQFCSHADPDSSLRKVIEQAIQLGFTHFGLSEHVPRESESHLYPEEISKHLTPVELKRIFFDYLSEARKLQQEHQNKGVLNLLVGLETENTKSEKEDLEKVNSRSLDYLIEILGSLQAERHEDREFKTSTRENSVKEKISFPEEIGKGVVDYLVGSVHHVHEIPIDFDRSMLAQALSRFESQEQKATDQDDSRRRTYHKLVSAYLDAQFEVLQRLRPEVIGHLDLPFLFDPELTWDESFHEESKSGSEMEKKVGEKKSNLRLGASSSSRPLQEETASWKRLERNVRFASSYGALFEINGAAFRKGWKTAYPSTTPLKLILSLSGRVCLSDDSHGTAQVGLNYLRSREYLLENKVESIWYLERRYPVAQGKPSLNTSELSEERDLLEKERLEREKGQQPGKGAPTAFERGTIALELKEWENDEFWEKLEKRRAQT